VRNKRFIILETAIPRLAARLAAARLTRIIMRRWEVRRILAAAAVQIY
jgi:ribosomal protein S3